MSCLNYNLFGNCVLYFSSYLTSSLKTVDTKWSSLTARKIQVTKKVICTVIKFAKLHSVNSSRKVAARASKEDRLSAVQCCTLFYSPVCALFVRTDGRKKISEQRRGSKSDGTHLLWIIRKTKLLIMLNLKKWTKVSGFYEVNGFSYIQFSTITLFDTTSYNQLIVLFHQKWLQWTNWWAQSKIDVRDAIVLSIALSHFGNKSFRHKAN